MCLLSEVLLFVLGWSEQGMIELYRVFAAFKKNKFWQSSFGPGVGVAELMFCLI